MKHNVLADVLGKYPKSIAFSEGENTYTFAALKVAMQNSVDAMRGAGINEHSVVALHGTYQVTYFSFLLAMPAIDCCLIPYTENGQLERTGVDTIVTHRIDQNGNIHITGNKAPAHLPLQSKIILQTSGTTAIPKLVVHDFRLMTEKYIRLKTPFITPLIFGLDHVSGIETALSILSAGGHIVLTDDRSPGNIAALIQDEQCNLLACSPTFLKLLYWSGASEKYNLSSLQIVNCGAEPMPRWLHDIWNELLPGCTIRQAFGTTETTNIRTYTKEDGYWFKPGIEGEDFFVADGKLYLEQNKGFSGYLVRKVGEWQLKHNKVITKNGKEWYDTHDLVEQDEEGYIYIKGRVEQLANIGGEKVNPVEVEQVLMKCGWLKDVKVYRKGNPLTGEMLVAEVLPIETVVDIPEFKLKLRNWCRQFLPEYKIPQKIIIVTAIEISNRLKRI